MEQRGLMALGHILTTQCVREQPCIKAERLPALTFIGQLGFQGFWQLGLLRMICVTLVALWIRSEKAIVQSIRQKCMSKYISEQNGNSVASVLHSPSRIEQNTMYSFLLRPFAVAKDHWLMAYIRRQDTDFISTTHWELFITIQCIEKKHFLLPPFDGQWKVSLHSKLLK